MRGASYPVSHHRPRDCNSPHAPLWHVGRSTTSSPTCRGSCSTRTNVGEWLVEVPLARAQQRGSSDNWKGRKTGSCPPHPIPRVQLGRPRRRGHFPCCGQVGRSMNFNLAAGLFSPFRRRGSSGRRLHRLGLQARPPSRCLPLTSWFPPSWTHHTDPNARTAPDSNLVPSAFLHSAVVPGAAVRDALLICRRGGQQGAAGARPAPAP